PPSIGTGVLKDTTYTYNDDKQLTKIERPDGGDIDFVYDSTTGNLTDIMTSSGNYKYGYSSLNKLLNLARSSYGMRSNITYAGELKTSETLERFSDDYLFGKVSFSYD